MVIFPLPLLEDQRDFSLVFTMRTWKSSWRKIHISESPWSVYLSESFTLSLQLFIKCSSDFLTRVLVPVKVGFCSGKLDSLYLPVYLSILHSSLLWHLISLADVRRAADFSVCLAFYLLLGGSYDSSAPDMLNWKPKSLRSIQVWGKDDILLLLPTEYY